MCVSSKDCTRDAVGSHISWMIKYVQLSNVPFVITIDPLDGDELPWHHFLAYEPEVLTCKGELLHGGPSGRIAVLG